LQWRGGDDRRRSDRRFREEAKKKERKDRERQGSAEAVASRILILIRVGCIGSDFNRIVLVQLSDPSAPRAGNDTLLIVYLIHIVSDKTGIDNILFLLDHCSLGMGMGMGSGGCRILIDGNYHIVIAYRF
jgi:hypothetical protein